MHIESPRHVRISLSTWSISRWTIWRYDMMTCCCDMTWHVVIWFDMSCCCDMTCCCDLPCCCDLTYCCVLTHTIPSSYHIWLGGTNHNPTMSYSAPKTLPSIHASIWSCPHAYSTKTTSIFDRLTYPYLFVCLFIRLISLIPVFIERCGSWCFEWLGSRSTYYYPRGSGYKEVTVSSRLILLSFFLVLDFSLILLLIFVWVGNSTYNRVVVVVMC